MDGTALIYSHGLLHTVHAKTSHGLIRGSDRYRILGAVDPANAGRDAGEVLDGRRRDLPVFASLQEAAAQGCRPDFLIIGIASAGGRLDPEWMPAIREALQAGISVVCGMHEFLSDQPELAALAAASGARLVDVRKPKPRTELHFWTGEILSISTPVIALLGTDCAIGKRTAARMLTEACRAAGIRSEMIFTGQTGWMQGGRYGFVLDSTPNDFVSGELEHAIVSCCREQQPDVIFLEGQAALRNPSGPCGSEYLVSGGARHAILVHAPARTYYKGWEHLDLRIPPVSSEIELIRRYGAEVIGLALNTQKLDWAAAEHWQAQLQSELGLPVALPVEAGVEPLVEAVRALLSAR
ncbi:MAG: DUF1611 domain-containing protein [Bacteroidia bacterium]|nr:DUF1611 domain-containing protein [Bacteroidia bacterium]